MNLKCEHNRLLNLLFLMPPRSGWPTKALQFSRSPLSNFGREKLAQAHQVPSHWVCERDWLGMLKSVYIKTFYVKRLYPAGQVCLLWRRTLESHRCEQTGSCDAHGGQGRERMPIAPPTGFS